MSLSIIPQTNRTILFEEINPEKPDLITLVGDVEGIESLDDDKIKEINDALLVKNFDEFLTKFKPTVYSYCNALTGKIEYTLKSDGLAKESITEIPLNKTNDFLNMLFQLIDTKRIQGKKDVDFNFPNVLNMISPEKVVKQVKQVRKDIHYLYNQYEELEKGNPKRKEIGSKLNHKMDSARENYSNILNMLPLAIEDTKQKLMLGGGLSKDGKKSEPIIAGVLTMSEQGRLSIIAQPKDTEKNLAMLSNKTDNKLAVLFKDDYDDQAGEKKNSYISDLVVRTFAPLTTTSFEDMNVEEEVAKYNEYVEFYRDVKESFIKCAKPLIEKILGVKMFFEQYSVKDGKMAPKLLLTNYDPETMVMTDDTKNRLRTYLKTVNTKDEFSNTIWFGIVPSVDPDIAPKKAKKSSKLFEDDEGDENNGKTSITKETLEQILNITKDYKIQVFFNFKATDETTFGAISRYGVTNYMSKTQDLVGKDYSEYSIIALPNLTVIPRDKSGVAIDKFINISEAQELSFEETAKFWIEGLYIDAAYIAAGLTTAWQCPEYLKQRFDKVSNDIPGVKFNIESDNNHLKVLTNLGKEISGFTTEVVDSVNKSGFGYVFSSGNPVLNGKEIKNIYVFKARSLGLQNNEYEPIYKTTTATYLERYMYKITGMNEKAVKQFFSNAGDSQMTKWVRDDGKINSIVNSYGDVKLNIVDSTCNMELIFDSNPKQLKINIVKSTETPTQK